ncbi:MAG TPA: precorrin-6y C5,15-methyltransferase (decarboxylating) subunit CbiE [Actinomycetota bacterium]|nr:precorrin-6y C5,15-methyltransferase (decarboxylating) subunit CbiE [Actinomycetota bacterium]
MSERAAVTVVGIGDDGWDGLTETARAALRQAPVIVGSTRQLALLPDLGVRRQPLPSPLLSQLDDLVASNPGLCLLASGDPMLHGLGATLARRLGAGRLRVLPAVSSIALACARLGWAGHEVDVVSLVSRPVEVVLPAVQPGGRAIVLCRDGGTPAALARLLADRGWGDSELTVLEHLGGGAEQVTGPLGAAAMGDGRYADLAVVALVCRPGRHAVVLPRVPGLPDDAYESDGQLTRREARALALAALAPGPGQLLWDVGAGSGSIGIEWMRVDARCRAVAVERRQDRVERVRRNATNLGVPDLEVVCGNAPKVLSGLPGPDAVFIGGGVTADGLLDTCWERLEPGGRLVAHAVTIESEAVLHRWQRAVGGHLVRLAASHAGPLGGFTAWRPALPVTHWQVTRP